MRRTFLVIGVVLSGCAHEPQPSHEHSMAAPAAKAQLFDNLGTYHRDTSCTPEAGKFFDQGLRLVYAFNHDESIRSFEEAARLDPDCASAFWGVAYANGPHINNPMLDPTHAKAAWDALEKAQAARKKNEVEAGFIAALARRYSADPKAERGPLDQAYADAMRELLHKYPDDVDAQTLLAEAMMDVHPWEMWKVDGKPQPWTDEIVQTLEHALAKNPDHPGANHFYIHAVEASSHPEKATASADKLPGLVPGAGHLVHMPAHIYMRVGRYEDAAEANRKAIQVDNAYVKKQPNQGFYLMYKAHNFQFLWVAAMMEGRSAEALQAARDMVAQVPPPMMEAMGDMMIVAPAPMLAMVRFGKWDEVLAEPPMSPKMPSAVAVAHFARGLAFLRKGKLEEAGKEQAELAQAAQTIDEKAMLGMTPARKVLGLAADLLQGEILARKHKMDEALRHLERAVEAEDQMHYDEPPDWPLSTRHYLGAVLLEAHRAKEAEKVYRADLERYPENGWSLYGLTQALKAQHEITSDAEARFEKAWSHADVKLTASRF